MGKYEEDSSENGRRKRSRDEQDDLHRSTSNDGDQTAAEATDDDDPDDLIEDGFDVGTHGGGQLEMAVGFDIDRPIKEGFDGLTVEVDEELQNLPPSCSLEFEEPETQCGRDDRVRISPATGLPWRMICQLIIRRADGGGSRCTGWFIGPRTVMTAGHCVYSHSAGGWARSIEVVPGMDASNRPYGSLVGRSFRSVRGWTRNPDPNYDYGAIILPNGSLGSRVGWFGFAALSDSSLRNLLLNSSGYSGDKPIGTQWYNAGRITRVTNRRLFYMLDTASGNSGGPTWRFRNGVRHAVGIHAYGGCPNKSTRINSDVFRNMQNWKNA